MGNGKNERVRNESEREPRGTTWYMGIWEGKKEKLGGEESDRMRECGAAKNVQCNR